MPYIAGATAHGVTHIADVYNSSNVFINNVSAALWQSPGNSAAFAGVNVDVAVTIPELQRAQAQALVDDYVAAQATPGTNKYYNAAAENDGVKANYAGTVEDGTTSAGILPPSPIYSDIIPFLEKTLVEANNGMWRETGQAGAASNKNITSIWTNLGYPATGLWTTDQTAWCMGFINFALKNAGYRYVQTASAAEITNNPSRWSAIQVAKENAQPGDIAFWSYRHVNFVYTSVNGKYSFVGGNQSPKASNNPNDGDVTNSYPNGTLPSNPNWVSCWRPVKV